ncbi:ATP-grasp fold amidoligase family protein [Ruminococcus sp. XPD3002]|uniref:ATP-grasp fold amidoligase family protein n=1 Tax=Ruminococcus sp. XPD3002 TaxID=1452269 RepID=UPI000912CC73|nr:TupA-like ATPgrasp [Ruminococcus flavefaciens]
MNKRIKKILTYAKSPDGWFVLLAYLGLFKKMEDKKYLKKMYLGRMGYSINLESPKKFNEKLQWLKLYDRKPEYTTMVDKYAVKKYVADIIGEQYIIPTLGVWDRFEDIDFDKLPNQFVLKCTHDSGGLVICRDKSKFDFKSARKKINKCLKRNYYYIGREQPYKNVVPRIIAEQYMEDTQNTDLRDYKFFCFNGEPVYCQVISERTSNETIDFFDMEWNHQEFTGLALPNEPFSSSPIPIPIPTQFDEMKKVAKILAKESAFLRVDFYEVKGNLYFGELTFYPASGFGVFSPDKYNLIIGKMLKLPVKSDKKFAHNTQIAG